MLLMDHPERLSTDIDIIVEPETPIDEYIHLASVVFPFVRYDEQKRIGKNRIEKRHIKFTYYSPINRREFYIMLDILFEENLYPSIEERPIKNELLITEHEDTYVHVPDVNCILGDKLTAFAPHTIGIPINIGKDMEVVKQFYDVCSLLDVFTDIDIVSKTYVSVAEAEVAYRGIKIDALESLRDTFWTSACIASRGKFRGDEYPLYVKGVRDLRNHIYSENYSSEIAAVRAAKVMYLVACLVSGTSYERPNKLFDYANAKLTQECLIPLQYLKKVSLESYSYVVESDQLMKALKENGIKL